LKTITSNFKTFITNRGDNTLEEKFKKILNRDNIKYFDTLIGYFRITGFNKIEDLLSNIEKCRILIGISTDSRVFEAYQLKKIFIDEQINIFNSDYDNIKYKNIKNLLELLISNKIEIRISANNDNHSKLYIFRNEKEAPFQDLVGSVIIGSSNLTSNGLVSNFEINTTLNQDRDIDEATQIFNLLWEEGVELSSDDIENSMLPNLHNYPPKVYNNIFYQILIEYFDGIIDNDVAFNSKVELFNYQKDALSSALMKINRYNGVILGDVVGLGKTIIAISILKTLNIKAIIIAPPATHNQWRGSLKDFDIVGCEIYSFDKLPKDNSAKMIIIDESHKLKNNKSQRYQKVERLCKTPFRKKVILLTATLQNNSPIDIANQIYLFQDKNSSNIPNIISLEKFFNPLISQFNSIKDINDKDEIIKDISTQIKDNILKYILIRRTREDISSHNMYKKDIDKFPKIEEVKSLEYNLGELSDDFSLTINYLENMINYNRFRVLNNLNDKGRDRYRDNNPTISDNIFKNNDLSTLAKYSFIKRFESSLGAFRKSISNAILSLSQFIKDLEDNKLYVGDKSNDILNRASSNKKYIYQDDKIYYIKKVNEIEERVYLKGMVISQNDLKEPQIYINSLKNDLDYLERLKIIWDNQSKDPKLDNFFEILQANGDNKIVIFTEYSDTLDYIKDKFPSNLKDKTLFVSSSNRDDLYDKISQNFDANMEIQKDDYNIIITTDTLAEGINLHRSNRLINYDLPWNSTKLMQRMGRINRIGSEFDTLDISSFKPVDESNNVIGILKKSYIKLQSFHYTLGEDSKILFDDEVVESFGISKDRDEELKYLEIIRDFKSSNPKEFEILKSKKESALSIESDINAKLSFFKIGDISYFYQDNNLIDFLGFIKYLEKSSKGKPIKSDIDNSINHHIMILNTKELTNNDLKGKLTKTDRDAILQLRNWYQKSIISNDIFIKIKDIIEAKTITTLSKEIKDLKDKSSDIIIDKLSSFEISTDIEIIDERDIKTKIYITLESKK